MKPAALFICYNSLADPLTHSQVIAYLRELAARGVAIHLLTFEGQLTAHQRQQFQAHLASSGITWHQLRYHKRPSLLATLYDVALGTLKAWRIGRKHNIQFIHARNHVPAAIALLLQRISGYRWLFDMRGLMAEEYVDGGNWRAGDHKYHLTKRMERAFFRHADEIVMLTERIKDELLKTEPALAGRADDITVIPCCVDLDRFNVSDEQRVAYRAARGWQDKCVITYAGKIGMWYLHEEMAQFFSYAWHYDPRFFFQVLTQSDPTPLRQALSKSGVPTDAYDIRFVSPEELPLVLMASDAGLSFIRACYSKLASSPTKNGEYWAAGLPIVINAGIGDSEVQTATHQLGVVLSEFSDSELERGVLELEAALATADTRNRCYTFAASELSLTNVGGPRYASIYDRLLAQPLPGVTALERPSAFNASRS